MWIYLSVLFQNERNINCVVKIAVFSACLYPFEVNELEKTDIFLFFPLAEGNFLV